MSSDARAYVKEPFPLKQQYPIGIQSRTLLVLAATAVIIMTGKALWTEATTFFWLFMIVVSLWIAWIVQETEFRRRWITAFLANNEDVRIGGKPLLKQAILDTVFHLQMECRPYESVTFRRVAVSLAQYARGERNAWLTCVAATYVRFP